MYIDIITVSSLIFTLIFQLSLSPSKGVILFNNRLSNYSNVHSSNQKMSSSRQTFPLINNYTTTPDYEMIDVKPINSDHRWKSNYGRNQSGYGFNSRGKFRQNHTLSVRFPVINGEVGTLQLLKQGSSRGQMVSSLMTPDDSIVESIVGETGWDLDDEGKTEMSKETMDSGDDIEEVEDDLMISESDDDYSNELYFSVNVDQVKSNESTSVKPSSSSSNDSIKVTSKTSHGNYIELSKLDLIKSINESIHGPLILTKLPVERSDQRQKSLRFPLMIPRSTHRNMSRLREGCSLRPSEFSRPKRIILHLKQDNL